jgi:hypothetical protein
MTIRVRVEFLLDIENKEIPDAVVTAMGYLPSYARNIKT